MLLVLAVPALRHATPGSDQIARYTLSGLITDDREERETLDRIAKADRVKALILYIDSPGGTTTGAEALYGAIRRVAEKKPVVAVGGTMAASGASLGDILGAALKRASEKPGEKESEKADENEG